MQLFISRRQRFPGNYFLNNRMGKAFGAAVGKLPILTTDMQRS